MRFVIVLLTAMGFKATAGTVAANSCSEVDVASALAAASDGDTVMIPNGTCTWTNGVSSSKQLTLRAQNFIPTPGGTATRSVTLIHSAGANTLLQLTTGDSAHLGLAGIKFVRGTGTGAFLAVSGNGTKVALVSDCYFDAPNNFAVLRNVDWTARGGVIWNTLWESTTPGGASGPGSGSGNLRVTSPVPWLNASTWGVEDGNGAQNLYIEDSAFKHIYNQALDCDDNCRVVVRHSTLLNSQLIHHGTTSLQGGRQSEFYNNSFEYRPATFGNTYDDVNLNRYLWIRAGTTRLTDNSIENITSGTWGNKSEFVFLNESLTRPGSGAPCQTTYPGTHWSGQGANGSTQISDPVRIYNNTGTWAWSTNDQTDDCGNGLSTANFFLIDRDIFLSAPASYTKYAYPHPLRAGTGSQDVLAPNPPTGLVAM